MFLTAVSIVTMTGIEAAPVGVTGFGETTQVAPRGKPLQVRLIGCEYPLTGMTCTVKVADCPADTDALGAAVTMEKSGSVEVLPERLATRFCAGWPATSSTIETEAVRVPAAEGVKSKVIVHWLLAASIAPHVLVRIAKSPEFGPTSETLVIFTAETPLMSVRV